MAIIGVNSTKYPFYGERKLSFHGEKIGESRLTYFDYIHTSRIHYVSQFHPYMMGLRHRFKTSGQLVVVIRSAHSVAT